MHYIGIDLGGSKIAAGIVDQDGTLIHKVKIKTPTTSSHAIVEALAQSCQMVLEEAKMTFSQIEGVGIACPGWVESETGIIAASANLPFNNTPIRDQMAAILGKEVRIHNDASCATVAEMKWGAAKGKEYALILTIGTGLGAGVIVDGKLYQGMDGAAGELGHTMLLLGGAQCGCGLKGCCEAYVSASAFVAQAQAAAWAHPDSLLHTLCEGKEMGGKIPFIASAQGDKVAQEMIATYINYLAFTITGFINIFRPEVVVVGGGLSNEGEALFAPLNKRMLEISQQNVYGKAVAPIIRAQMGNDAGIYGAAALFTIQ